MYLEEFRKRSKELEKLISELETRIPKLPSGNIRISKKNKWLQYFLITEKADTHGKYLKKGERQIAFKIAQRDYYEKLLKESKREKQAIDKYVSGMKGIRPEEVYEELNDYRKAIVQPIILSDEEYVRRWLAEEYRGNPYNPEERIQDTNRGEKVRTKSEARLADIFYEMGIPYRYEYPVKLYNGKIKYPDFALLKMPERKEIYLEHMGLLEDEQYRRNNLIKLQEYNKSGIVMGDNLILTFETEYAPLSIKDTKDMIKRIFFG